MKQAAFRTGLNSRLQNERIFVLDGDIASVKTKDAIILLAQLGLSDYKLLILASAAEPNIQLGARNLPKVTVQTVGQTNLTDVLRSEAILCTKNAWQEMAERVAKTKEGA